MTDQTKPSIPDQVSQAFSEAMPDQPELAPAIAESISEALTRASTLIELGFHQDMMGQFILPNAKVVFYDVGGDWEVDISAPKGYIGFDVPMGDIGVKLVDDEDNPHRLAVIGLRYLLRDYTRDELLKLIDEAEIPRDCDIDGWSLNQGQPDDWPDSEASKYGPE
jgi:hypothetical protein